MIGFHILSNDLYGLPERKAFSRLENTDNTWPYRLFAFDGFPPDPNPKHSIYSGIPYLMGHSKNHEESVILISAADIWVDISSNHTKEGKIVNFIVESGVLDFFLFASDKPN
jgi:alpha-glucosidase (family GH31 glycosyl hydrolase)